MFWLYDAKAVVFGLKKKFKGLLKCCTYKNNYLHKIRTSNICRTSFPLQKVKLYEGGDAQDEQSS